MEPEINLTDPAERRISARDLQVPPAAGIPSTAGMTTKVVKGSFWSLVGQVLPLSITFFTTPFVIRLLGTESYGLLVLINLTAAYFSFADFGMNMGSTKFASDAYGRGARDEEGKVVRTAALIAFLFSLPFAAAIFLFSSAIAEVLNVPPELWPSASAALKISAFSLMFLLLSNIFNSPQLSRLRMDLNLIVNAGFKILGIGGMLAVLYLGWGLPGAVAATTIAAFLTLVGHIVVSGRLLPELYKFSIERTAIKPLLKFGGALVISTIAAMLLVNLEKLVLTRVVSVRALAYYSVAFIIANMAALFSSSMTQSLLPAFSQLLRPEKKAELSALFSRCVRINLLALFPVIIVMFVAARPFFTIWAGEEFGRESTLPFYILLGGLAFNLIAYISYSLLVASGRTDLLAKIYWIELLPYIALVILLTTQYGIAGAAAAWSIRVIIDALVFIYLAHKASGLGLSFSGINKYMILPVLLMGTIPLLSMFFFDNIYLTLTLTGVFIIAYFSIAWKNFTTSEERGWLGRFLKRN